jgi:hypothetical protein
VHQHGADDSGGFKNKKFGTAQRKTSKDGQKERTRREDHEGKGKPREKLPSAGDVKNGTAGL